MSIHYRPLKSIAARDLFDGRLEAYGITEHWNAEGSHCLHDSMSYVHVYEAENGNVSAFARYAGNNACYILSAIEEVFEVRIVSEYEPECWGFETQAEWDAARQASAREAEDSLYQELRKFLTGLPHEIRAGTIDHEKAQVAKQLVANEPRLMDPESRDSLMALVNTHYRDSSRKVVQIPEETRAAFQEWYARTADPYGTRGAKN